MRWTAHEEIIRLDSGYSAWIQDLKARYQSAQIKASVSVNREMLRFYWSLGRDIVQKKAESFWSHHFYETLSGDLQRELPQVKGLSATNLKYMKYFYEMTGEICPQPADEIYHGAIRPQLADELETGNLPQTVAESGVEGWSLDRTNQTDRCPLPTVH